MPSPVSSASAAPAGARVPPRLGIAARDAISQELRALWAGLTRTTASARADSRRELGAIRAKVGEILAHSALYIEELKAVLGDVTTEDALARVAAPLSRQTEAVQRYLAAFAEESARSEGLTRQALARCESIRRARLGIGQVSQLSNILRLSAKVETVYLGNAGGEFESLAEEMKALNRDVMAVSQSIDDLVGELAVLLEQMLQNGDRMRRRTTTFGAAFSGHAERVRRETERLQDRGVMASATGDEAASRLQNLASQAEASIAFSGELEAGLDRLDAGLAALCGAITRSLSIDPVDTTVVAAPGPATPAPPAAQDPGDFLLF